MLRTLFFLVFSLVVLPGCSSQVVTGPLPEPGTDTVHYEPPEVDEWKLSNNLTVLYLRDDELPLVSGTLYLPGGSLYEEAGGKIQLAAMGSQLRLGGTEKMSPEQLDLELQKLAASVSSSFGSEYGTVSFQCLESDFERVFEIFHDVLLTPRFDEKRLDVWKSASLDGIKRRKDDSGTIASLSLTQSVYGGSRYGYVSTTEDVQAVAPTSLFEKHREYVHPDGAYLVVTGSVEKEVVEELVQKYFSQWQNTSEERAELPAFEAEYTPEILFVEMASAKQSSIYIGQPGVKRHTADRYAITAFNEVFGSGGFDSRLMRRVRTELGLAYSVYGAIIPGREVGENIIAMQTKSESTPVALAESLDQLRQLQSDKVEKKELQTVKTAAQNAFVFRYDTPGKLLQRKALLRILDYPDDYDEDYLENLNDVSREDILTVAQSRWDLEKLVIVVVGDKNAYTLLENYLSSASGILSNYKLTKRTFDETLQ